MLFGDNSKPTQNTILLIKCFYLIFTLQKFKLRRTLK